MSSSRIAVLPDPAPVDFVELFMELTEGSFSPDLFRRWSAISLVGATLERRCWVKVSGRRTYPNIYVFLVAPPGVGKQVIDDARELAREVKDLTGEEGLQVAPDSMTKASMIDQLARSKRIFLPPGAEPPVEYHSMYVAAEEVSVFMPNYDLEFLGILNKLYNNPPDHSETRRHGPQTEVKFKAPQINLLAGVQPGWMASVFPDEAWSTGLTSRLFMVYASETKKRGLFDEVPGASALRTASLARLRAMTGLHGEFDLTDEATKRLVDWHAADGPPAPTHSKLEHYCRRRTNQHVIKLSAISAVARTGRLLIELIDVNRAIEWLCEAERLMPDIFRAMVGRSDSQIIEELHYFVQSTWQMQGREALEEHHLWNFLQQRVPSDKIQKILEAAERSNAIKRVEGTGKYVPSSKLIEVE